MRRIIQSKCQLKFFFLIRNVQRKNEFTIVTAQMGALDNFNINEINLWVLIPASLIILLLSFLERRKQWQDVCNGHPALLIPFRFLDGYENRTAYAMAFGTITNTVVSLIMSKPTLDFELPLWAKALYVYLQAFVGCLICFPLFACLTTRYRALGAILCMLYSVLWLSLKLVQLVHDVEQIADESRNATENNGTVFVGIHQAYEVLQNIPVLLCYVVLIGYCFYILHRCYTTKTYFHMRIESTVKPHQEEYVRWVFRKFKLKDSDENSDNSLSSQTLVNKMKDNVKLKYFTNFPFFKYPVRIFALAFVQLNISYWAGLFLVYRAVIFLYPFINTVIHTLVDQYELDLVIIFSVCSLFSLVSCIFNSLAQIFIGTRNYRCDMLRIYQGDKSLVTVLNNSPQNILTRSMALPGYQMAFILWGTILYFVTVMLLTCSVVLLFYFSAKLDALGDTLLQIAQVLSFPAIALLLFYLQVFMAKRVLLQDKLRDTDDNPPLNVDNRKFFEVVSYYSLFTNMAVGLLTCLLRILQSALLGICFIGRLDRTVFPQEMETWDRGYAAYISMLLVDNAHNNPCMRVFAHLLWTRTLAVRLREVQAQQESNDSLPLVSELRPRYLTSQSNVMTEESPTTPSLTGCPWTFIENSGVGKSSRAIRRWYLIYTLTNNPQLCKLRKHKLTKDGNISRKSTIVPDAQEKSDTSAHSEDDLLLFDESSTPDSSNSPVLLIDVNGSEESSNSFT